MKFTTLAATLFFALASFTTLPAHTQDVTIPAVETWTEMAVPYPDSPKYAEKLITKFYKDPRGKGYEGAISYVKDARGQLIPVLKSWNFWHPANDESYRIYKEVRCAILLENGSWFVGDPGEMFRMHWENDPDGKVESVIMTYLRAHSHISRTFKFK